MNVIHVQNLQKHYSEVKAVDGISFQVHQGEVFGFLGPNGAGKTTTIEILEGFHRQDQGEVKVLGLDPQADRYELQERIGVMLQETELYQDLRVGELLRLFASYYRNAVDPKTLLEMIGLEAKERAFIRELSGGQRQRVVFILTLINDPDLLFLDEPTAGLDPQSRRAIWNWINRGRQEGKTVFLTTHYIEEAERLCDRVAIIDYGRIIALDTPKSLRASAHVENRIEFTTEGNLDTDKLRSMPHITSVVEHGRGTYTLFAQEAEPALKSLIALSEENGFRLRGLHVEGASLEDVFIQLTGRRIRA
ncbi:MAG TPA: ABC transporter ATP-binding protein [Anaerolineae bacterium]|nr:ABC transporter ATP-binding protein [Anaerolineae bacterium]